MRKNAAPILMTARPMATLKTESTGAGYYDIKRAAKDRRRELYEMQQERLKRVKSRRANKPRNEKRREFREWFIRKKVHEEYLDRKARQANKDWKINVAVILERPAVVLPDIEDWEKDYLELEAHLGQYGKLYPKEFMGEIDEESVPLTQEELLQYLPKGFTPAPRETEADATGDVRTTNRKLKTSVYLALKENGAWQLPTVELKSDEETLLEAAKRAIETKIGRQVEFWCPSNAPFAVDMQAHEEEHESVFGTKTFFMKIQYDEGDVLEADLVADDFGWLDRSEMSDRVREGQGDDAARFYQYML